MPGVRKLWSKGYRVTDAEIRELHKALDRHDGLFYLAAAAGFAADHKAQSDRLDFGQLFEAFRDRFPFLVGGSDEDPFEPRQVDLAERRLGKLGLRIARLPGGHLTTAEHPEALAALIAGFERTLVKAGHGNRWPPSRGCRDATVPAGRACSHLEGIEFPAHLEHAVETLCLQSGGRS